MKSPSAEAQLAGFLAQYTPEVAAVARAARKKLQAILPGAVEMVYDNYNALVIGFGPTERTSEAIMSMALYPRWVNLFFLAGAVLPDPHRILKGSGKIVRHIRLDDASILDRPEVRDLIAAAIDDADKPFDPKSPRRLIIKSVSARQRARRPA